MDRRRRRSELSLKFVDRAQSKKPRRLGMLGKGADRSGWEED